MIQKEIICHPVTFGGSTEKGKPYDNFKSGIRNSFKPSEKIPFKDVDVNISLYLYSERLKRGNDLDNFLKPIIDALEGKAFSKESQVKSISIKRVIVSAKDEEKLSLKISI